ncbi:MAG: 4-(cytidine 5'-diphospho)-2-C-methyl-D-erythritol kinase [Candidatus Krumholzibacteriota bacterium]|nr:4-(cytidine 5'-diphospho)-2-C-methyl-D-erythritol kinase [Candidatus Krumholzibacteriota bacterium]
MREADSISVRCAAKINLYLAVTGKREDGYHDIETLFQPLSLYDNLALRPRRAGIELHGDDPAIAWDETNLCHRAAAEFFARTGLSAGVDIEVQKAIPPGAGLGGGSSDAAGMIIGLNRLFGTGLSNMGMRQIALSIGADVPFFVFGVPAIGRGRGEILEAARGLPGGWVVIVKPGFEIPTAWAYQNLKIILTRFKSRAKLKYLLEGLKEFPDSQMETYNCFSEMVIGKYPEIGEIAVLLEREGSILSSLSGSGSAYFGLFSGENRAKEVRDLISDRGFFAVVAKPVNKTVELY